MDYFSHPRAPQADTIFDEAFWDSFWRGAFPPERDGVIERVKQRFVHQRANAQHQKANPRRRRVIL